MFLSMTGYKIRPTLRTKCQLVDLLSNLLEADTDTWAFSSNFVNCHFSFAKMKRQKSVFERPDAVARTLYTARV